MHISRPSTIFLSFATIMSLALAGAPARADVVTDWIVIATNARHQNRIVSRRRALQLGVAFGGFALANKYSAGHTLDATRPCGSVQ